MPQLSDRNVKLGHYPLDRQRRHLDFGEFHSPIAVKNQNKQANNLAAGCETVEGRVLESADPPCRSVRSRVLP